MNSLMGKAAAGAFVFLEILLSNNAVSAQTAGQTQSISQPSAEAISRAKRLVTDIGIYRSFDVMIDSAIDQIRDEIQLYKPELAPNIDRVIEKLRPTFYEKSAEMLDISARAYLNVLTEGDIEKLIAFYESDVGRKYVSVQPIFIEQMIGSTQAWRVSVHAEMLKQVETEATEGMKNVNNTNKASSP